MRLLLYWGRLLADSFIALGSWLGSDINILGFSVGSVGDIVLTSALSVALTWKITKFFVGIG